MSSSKHDPKKSSMLLLGALILCCTFAFQGCDAEKFEVASGTVTHSKGDLEHGLITWVPVDGTAGRKVSADIVEGEFAVADIAGLRPGKYRVEIFAIPDEIRAMIDGRNPHQEPAGGKSSEPFREVDGRFNVESTLVREIKAGEENVFDFEIEFSAIW